MPRGADWISHARPLLAFVFSEAIQAQRLAHDAGIVLTSAAFTGTAMDFWQAILTAAEDED